MIDWLSYTTLTVKQTLKPIILKIIYDNYLCSIRNNIVVILEDLKYLQINYVLKYEYTDIIELENLK